MKLRKLLIPAALLLASATAQAADFIVLDRAMARQLADPLQHRQPTVLALWSIDCTHCKKNLQALGELARKNPRLRVLTVATEPSTVEHQAVMARYAVPGHAYAYGSDAPEALAFALDSSWAGELPRTFLFDGKGGRKNVSGVLGSAAIEQGTGLR